MMLNFLITIDVPNWMETALRTLFYGLCAMIYKLVIVMYNIFDLLCTVRILDMDVVDSLAQRIGLILGLVMLFIVIFSLINSLINPDLVSDKAKSPVNLIKKVLLVIVMFGVSTFAFNGLYYVQKVVIKSNVIVKLFVPGEVETDNFGNFLTKEMFMSFYTINEDLEGVSDSDIDTCEGIIENLEDNIEEHGTFEIGRKCLYKTIDVNGDKVFIVDFSYFYSLIVGGFLVYFIFMYCLSVGVRTFQLVFLEIISPMAFVGYLSPKNDNMFSKWIKMYFSTYLDLFIRIGIISFATFIIGAILGNGTDYGNLLDVIGGTSGLTKTILKILLIFALLTFAKKAPDLLKDLFPSGASKLGLGLSSPKKMFDSMLGGNLVRGGMIGAAGLGVGAAIGGVGNAVRGAIGAEGNWKNRLKGAGSGLLGGLTSGGLAGAKAKGIGKAFGASNKAAAQQNKRIADWRAAGGVSTVGRWGTGLQQRMGLRTTYEGLEADYEEAKKYTDAFSSAKKKADGEVDKFASNYYFEDAAGNNYSLLELDKMRNDDAHYTASERALFDDVYNKIHGLARDHAMSNNGAVKSGKVTWADNGTGDWGQIEQNRTDNYTAADIDVNSEIEQNMEYVAKSDIGKATAGSIFDKAKAANKSYETKVNSKINDQKYKTSKANYDATKGK